MAVLIFIGVIVAMGIHVQLHFAAKDDAVYDHTDPANIARSIDLYLADEL